jgi:hypothetical protein
MYKREGVYFNCFSPPVMIATMVIELSLAVYTTWRYKLNNLVRLIVAMLIGLAVFQLAEYFVCTGIGSMAAPWSRVGFIAITALPPLGLHIMHKLAGKPQRRLVKTAYVTMAAYMLFFLAWPGTFTGHQCTGNYVIFQFTPNVTGTYTIYYFGWLLAGIGLGFRWANQLMSQGKSKLKQLQSVQGLILGYLVFLIPSAISMVVKPDARRGIPSVLCGFAVLLALTLVLYILPRAASPRTS